MPPAGESILCECPPRGSVIDRLIRHEPLKQQSVFLPLGEGPEEEGARGVAEVKCSRLAVLRRWKQDLPCL